MLTELEKINVRQNGITKDDVMHGITLYHRPKDAMVVVGGKRMSVIDSLFKYGFSREFTGSNGGNMYGAGVYSVYNLRSSNEKAIGYGSSIIKLKLLGGYKDFLIFSKQLAQETYGNNWQIVKQVKYLFDNDLASKILENIHLVMHDDSSGYVEKSSICAHSIIRLLGESGMNNSRCRGLVYNGGHDGACCFIRDFSSVIPVGISKDNGRTWQYRLSDELINRINNEVDTHFQFGSDEKYAKVSEKSINGYVMVWNKEGKVNYISAQSNEPISNVWFDDGEYWKILDDGTPYTNIKYHNKYYIVAFENNEYMLYGDDWEPLDMTLNDLNNVNENKKTLISINELKCLVMESINKFIFENKSFIDNFDFVANLLDVNSPDDFHFVQIIKRLKDNKNDDKTKGNYHGGAWYLGGFRVHNAQELMALKSKIISICDKNNARAYITVNKRSDKETDDYIKVYRRHFKPTDARYIHADEIIPGQAKDGPNWMGKRKRLIIDIDVPNDTKTKEGDNLWDEVKDMIKMTGIVPLGEYVTPSGGLHIILPDKEDKRFVYLKQLFKKFDNWEDKGRLATVHPNVDAKIILYSNVTTAGY